MCSALEKRLKEGSVKPRMLYTIPVFQNPSGATIPHHNRVRLAYLANQYDLNVVGDEVQSPLECSLQRALF